MKKIGLIFIFIFLTGLFSGLFFSTGLRADSMDRLSGLMMSGFSGDSPGFARVFAGSVASNFTLVAVMAAAMLSKALCPLPPALLLFKSFATGFCSGLIYVSVPQQAFFISLTKLLPQNVFFIPGFIITAASLFIISASGGLRELSDMRKKSRNENSRFLLLSACAGTALIAAGAAVEGLFSLISL